MSDAMPVQQLPEPPYCNSAGMKRIADLEAENARLALVIRQYQGYDDCKPNPSDYSAADSRVRDVLASMSCVQMAERIAELEAACRMARGHLIAYGAVEGKHEAVVAIDAALGK